MTQTYGPFDAGAGADMYEAAWSEMAELWLSTGVIRGLLNELEAYADSSGMQVKIKSGKAWMKGHFFKSDAEEILAISTADPDNDRIDRVIIRLDWSANTIALAILEGTPAGSPTAPALTQNSSIWEISLAQVLVDEDAATIAAGKITDERTFAGELEAWITPTLLGTWVDYGGSYPPVRYAKDTHGMVHLDGVGKTGGTNSTIFTLPSGYRPALLTAIKDSGAIYNDLSGALIEVDTNGDVKFVSGLASTSTNLSACVPFKATQ